MKNLIIINGTMGAGKTATSLVLKEKLNNAVFLDGDWCWDMSPFTVNCETKEMVMNNIHFLLNSFIKCSVYENIIFCWVMHEESIIDDVIKGLDTANCKINKFTLYCNREALEKRIRIDINNGKRNLDVLERSIERIEKYRNMNTTKIDVSDISCEDAAKIIEKCIL